jgi:hypothetical protein
LIYSCVTVHFSWARVRDTDAFLLSFCVSPFSQRKFCVAEADAAILPTSPTVPTVHVVSQIVTATASTEPVFATNAPDTDLGTPPTSGLFEVSSSSSQPGGPNVRAIFGWVLGALVLLALVGFVCFCVVKERSDPWNEKLAGRVHVRSGRDDNWVQVMGLNPPPLPAASPEVPSESVGREGDGPDGPDGHGRAGKDETWVQVMGLDPPRLAPASPDAPPVDAGHEGDGPDGPDDAGWDENWVQAMRLDPPPLVAAERDTVPAAFGLQRDGHGVAGGAGAAVEAGGGDRDGAVG